MILFLDQQTQVNQISLTENTGGALRVSRTASLALSASRVTIFSE